MSKMLDFIKAIKASGKPVSLHVPVLGWVDAKIVGLDDDMVTIEPPAPATTVNFVVHYAQVWVRANRR